MADRPNILWICPDQQRSDSIHSLGNNNINTPNIDEIVEGGVAFTKAYAQNPLCQPSRSSFLTGRYPRTVGVRQNGQKKFPSQEKLVTKKLSEIGYDCGLVGKLHLSSAEGRVEPRPNDGYSVYKWNHDPYYNPNWEPADDYQKWLREKGYNWDELYTRKDTHAQAGVREDLHQAYWCAEESINFIEDASSPWLLSLNMFDPHHPYDPPAKYLDRYEPSNVLGPSYQEGELKNKPFPQRSEHFGAYGGERLAFSDLTLKKKKEVIAAYYAQVELVDAQVGRVLNYLKENNLTKNTMIIYMSDHGTMLGDHGLYIKGPYFYEETVKVPLIFSWPGKINAGVQRSELVELVDIVPTIYDILGVDIPESVQGKSLLTLLEEDNDSENSHRKDVYSEFYNSQKHDYEGQDAYATMYHDGRYKLVTYHGVDEGELYDLQKDPHEHENLWYERISLRNELLKKSYDRSVFTMDPLPKRVGAW